MNRPWYLKKSLLLSTLFFFTSSFVTPFLQLTWAQEQNQSSNRQSYEEVIKRLDRGFKALEEIENGLDKSPFDVVEKTRALGRDAERIFAFVRDEIRYEPYYGVLRGATGTLMTGAGNSADKSVLLAKMLGVAGYKIRFVSGRLDQKTIKKLVSKFFNDNIRLAGEVEDSDLENTMKTVYEDLGINKAQVEKKLEEQYNDLEDLQERFWNRVDADHKLISSLLKERGVRLGTGVSPEELGREAAEHYWIRYKDSSGKWLDLDPSVPGSGIGKAPGKAQKTLDKLPDELFHRLTVVSTLKTGPSEGGSDIKVADHTLIEKSFRTSDTYSTAIRYMNVPAPKSAMGKDARTSLLTMFNAVKEFTATFSVGDKVIPGKSFDLEGNVYEKTGDEDYRVEAANKLRKTMGGGFGALTEALDGGGDAEKKPAPKKGRVLGQWLTYSLTSPMGAGKPPVTKEFQRFLLRYDKVVGWSPTGEKTAPAGVRKKTDLTTGLMQTQQLIVLTGRVSPAFLDWNQLKDSIESRPLMEMLLREAFDRKDGPKGNDTPLTGQRPMQLLTFALNTDTSFNQALEGRFPGLRAYRARPSLVLWKEHFEIPNPDDIKLVRGFDIADNPVRVASRSADDKSVISVSIMRGIIDTAMEHFLVSHSEGSEAIQKTVSASSILNSAVKSGIKLNVLDKRFGGLGGLAKLKLSAAVKCQIATDIKDGYVVIAPGSAVGADEQKEYAWWRIDPATGKTLGMMPGPAGQGFVEYLKMIDEASAEIATIRTFANMIAVYIAIGAFAVCVSGFSVGGVAANAAAIAGCIAVAYATFKGVGGSFVSGYYATMALAIAAIMLWVVPALSTPSTSPKPPPTSPEPPPTSPEPPPTEPSPYQEWPPPTPGQ